jgi:hypothetical protein
MHYILLVPFLLYNLQILTIVETMDRTMKYSFRAHFNQLLYQLRSQATNKARKP